MACIVERRVVGAVCISPRRMGAELLCDMRALTPVKLAHNETIGLRWGEAAPTRTPPQAY